MVYLLYDAILHDFHLFVYVYGDGHDVFYDGVDYDVFISMLCMMSFPIDDVHDALFHDVYLYDVYLYDDDLLFLPHHAVLSLHFLTMFFFFPFISFFWMFFMMLFFIGMIYIYCIYYLYVINVEKLNLIFFLYFYLILLSIIERQ